MREIILIVLLTAVVLAGCKKSDTELPPPIIPENEVNLLRGTTLPAVIGFINGTL